MGHEPTPEERRRADDIVAWWMLVRVWRELINCFDNPSEMGAMFCEEVTREFEAFLEKHLAGHDAEVGLHLALNQMEHMWRTIRAPFPAGAPRRPDGAGPPGLKRRRRKPKA